MSRGNWRPSHVIAVVGIAVIIAGAWGAVVLIAQKADTPVPLRHLAIVIGRIGTELACLALPGAANFAVDPREGRNCAALKLWPRR